MPTNSKEIHPTDHTNQDLVSDFRTVMRGTAQSVTIITSSDANGNSHGMAASAVISLSMEPPSMCISVNRSASIHPVLAVVGGFCINLLSADQTDLVETFSRSDQRDRRFTSSEWRRGPSGLPYLASARAAIFCSTDHTVDYSTHTLHIGRVTDLKVLEKGPPLLWFDGAYAAMAHPLPFH
jgi:flavin reductase (DIM6/NTAB) family NADH-FMN oxidoreductase RutF